ncbi:MAG: HAD family phosphatase [Bacteroidota bacterium]
MQNIKNIIFDLGGVILDIDFKRTEAAFHLLGWDDFLNHINQFHITDLFEKYETGKISDADFVKGIQQLIGKPVDADKIIAAWNALLVGFPAPRINLLKKLKNKYRTFLLSNTNSIHHDEFQQRLFKEQGVYLEDLFEKTYYSHAVKLRKPEAPIFELVLKENNLIPQETLFIDDTAMNFSEAEKLGIQVHHLTPGSEIMGIGL